MNSHRIFKPVILFHDYSKDSNGVTHRIHIPYGDPYYTPLIQQKKYKVGLMLKSNGKAWNDIIQSTRQSTPPLLKRIVEQHSSDDDEEDDDDDSQSSFSTVTSPVPTSINNNNNNHTSPITTSTFTRKRRGNLPKSVTAILKQWLIDHCRNPYPTEAEKTSLKDKTGLTLNQISNWFINARRRLLPQILDSVVANNVIRHHHNHQKKDQQQQQLQQLQQQQTQQQQQQQELQQQLYNNNNKYDPIIEDPIPMSTTTSIKKRKRYNYPQENACIKRRKRYNKRIPV